MVKQGLARKARLVPGPYSAFRLFPFVHGEGLGMRLGLSLTPCPTVMITTSLYLGGMATIVILDRKRWDARGGATPR